MSHVLIVIEPATTSPTCDRSPPIAQGISALKQAILQDNQTDSTTSAWQVEVVTTTDLAARLDTDPVVALPQTLLCPLTLNLPTPIPLAAQSIYQSCRDQVGLRQRVEQWQYATGTGDLWLPIVQTAKGALYAEVIGQLPRSTSEGETTEPTYSQPIHLNDEWRQPLYELGFRLLKTLAAPPAVYLMQFGITEQTLYFDRLLPFPDLPAIASLGIQTPNLFLCHWHCLIGKPIYDLMIAGHHPIHRLVAD